MTTFLITGGAGFLGINLTRFLLERGHKAGTFRAGVDPVQLYISIAGLSYFYLGTNHTLSDIGMPWIRAYHSTTMYFHGSTPNGRSCAFPPGRIMTTASSRHPGGVNLLMSDGSSRFVSDDISVLTWRALGSRNGDEVISDTF